MGKETTRARGAEPANQEVATTAVAVAPTHNIVPIKDVHDLDTLGQKYAQSGFFGQITPSQGFLVAMSQHEEGVSVTEWIRRHQVIGNTISTKPNWMLGEFKRRGGKAHIVRADRECCEIEFTHWDDERLTVKITMDDMKQTSVPFGKDGKTLKTNWQNFADDMLFARVCGKGLRRICPEVFCGMYTDGEVRDFERPAGGDAPAPREAKPVVAAVSESPIAEPNATTGVGTPNPDVVDYGICPCGTVKGKRWEELSTEMLEKIMASKAKAVTADHRNAIVAELGRREEAESEAGEAIEPEVVEV